VTSFNLEWSERVPQELSNVHIKAYSGSYRASLDVDLGEIGTILYFDSHEVGGEVVSLIIFDRGNIYLPGTVSDEDCAFTYDPSTNGGSFVINRNDPTKKIKLMFP
jgi:hypothetical protein